MQRPLDNQHIIEIKPLPSPRTIKSKLPITDQAAALVVETRDAIRHILHGQDRERLLVIVGPCSIHDPEAAYEYADRLKPVADALRDRLLIVMRTYFEKPRTTVGWKGLINDPHLDGTCDIAAGMELARTILLNINKRGVPCAAEALDPVSPQYIADLWSWVAIGARTTESQPHREMASGLSMPVGFKNGTEGNLQVAWNAMVAAKQPHHFLGINADGLTSIIKTMGNPDRHIVLRGGGGKTNYEAEHVARAEASTILGQAVAEPQSVLQGPSCLYRVKGRERVVALSVAPGSISTIQRRGRDVIKLRLRNRAGFCVNYGRPKVIVPLTRGRLLSVAAPCQIAARFASVALPRIPS